ncbi:hypothetical protein CTAYLR_007836 [Chrysophaeum taylorii]|uniref:Vacuolar protein sorting-associated protein 35 n=1 Tax=Chrysophaeum taylorii TaxID=2483200 RepID=A0AAD7XM54_9STRA|nr:hypothetical protein CTAYLR_007836 [Chrysophaeum taylorii]
MAAPGSSDLDNQEAYLKEATRKVKEQGFFMKRCMDSSDLKGALNHASDMLRELRTGVLTPRNYYELHMKTLDELHHLDDFFGQLCKDGTKTASELYEQVQACGDVLPRLYLLITVGATYIETRQAPAKDILNDLVEMAKGVQHPMRGLFLRNYLSHACRDKLPDTGSKFEGQGGDVSHAVDFVLRNFSETNRLWVRMQNQGPSKERKRREKERQDLRILVGTNLVRLSQLEGVDVERYVQAVLPKLLEQVVNCKDSIAQPYLLDCIIQVFPDEFHLATLDSFLETCTQLRDKVNVRVILEAMMKRLAAGARDAQSSSSGEAVARTPPKAFAAFNSCVTKLLEEKKGAIELAELLRLQAALLEFALECYPGRLDYVNHCFGTCAAVLRQDPPRTEPLDDTEAEQLERVLALPLAPSGGLGGVLELTLFGELVEYLPWRRRRDVSLGVVRAVLGAGEPLDSVESVEKLFSMIGPLLRDGPDDATGGQQQKSSATSDAVPDEATEQLLVARLSHLFQHDDTDALFRIFGAARRHFGQGGIDRVRYTLVPLVFRALALARAVRAVETKIAEQQAEEQAEENKKPAEEPPPPTEKEPAEKTTDGEEEEAPEEEEEEAPAAAEAPAATTEERTTIKPPQYSSRKVFQFVHEIVTAMAGSFPSLSLNLFLQCAQEADKCGFKAIAYEFVSQAFIIYEDELPDSKAQLRALHSMVGSLLLSRGFDDSDYDALATKTTQYAAKLLKKPDQCRMVATCSLLFWSDDPSRVRDGRRVLECLQRSLKIADACMTSSSPPIHLFVEILDHYVAHFEKKNPMITPKYIQGLVALINEHIDNMDRVDGRADLEAHYRNTLARIKAKEIIPLP